MRRHLTLFSALMLCLALCAFAFGQSGRKQKKADPQPPVQGVNQPETRVQPEPQVDPEAKPEKEKERGPTIMIATGWPDVQIPNFYADVSREACLRELRDVLKSSVELREARNQHRGDAIKAAKEDERTYVVWMELVVDNFASTSGGVDLRYTIFEPKTGRVAGSGSGFPRQPSGMSMPPVGASRAQVYLDWMGRDVAQQVMGRLKLRSGY
jgi:hypothetical protein